MGMSIASAFVVALLSQQATSPSSPAENSTQPARSADSAAAREQLLMAKRIVDNAINNTAMVGVDRDVLLRPAIEPLRQALVGGDRSQQLEALMVLAFLYGEQALHEPVEEEDVLTRIVELAPGEIGARVRLAGVQEGLGEFDRAEQTLRQAKVDFPNDGAKANRALAQFFNRRAIDAERQEALSRPAPARVRQNEPARLLKGEMPPYPATAPALDKEATVVVEALISATGKVVAATVLQSIPSLDSTAVAAVMRWMFAPAIQEGRAVSSKIAIPVVFKKSKQ